MIVLRIAAGHQACLDLFLFARSARGGLQVSNKALEKGAWLARGQVHQHHRAVGDGGLIRRRQLRYARF